MIIMIDSLRMRTGHSIPVLTASLARVSRTASFPISDTHAATLTRTPAGFGSTRVSRSSLVNLGAVAAAHGIVTASRPTNI